MRSPDAVLDAMMSLRGVVEDVTVRVEFLETAVGVNVRCRPKGGTARNQVEIGSLTSYPEGGAVIGEVDYAIVRLIGLMRAQLKGEDQGAPRPAEPPLPF